MISARSGAKGKPVEIKNIEDLRKEMSLIDKHPRDFGYYGHELRDEKTDKKLFCLVKKGFNLYILDLLLNSPDARWIMDRLKGSKTLKKAFFIHGSDHYFTEKDFKTFNAKTFIKAVAKSFNTYEFINNQKIILSISNL